MNKISFSLTFLFFFFFHTTALSQWIKINETEQAIHYIDKTTVTKNSRIYDVWWLMNFKPHIASQINAKSVVGQSRIDCKKRMFLEVKKTVFSDFFGNGIGTIANIEVRWESPSPNSLSNSLIREVC